MNEKKYYDIISIEYIDATEDTIFYLVSAGQNEQNELLYSICAASPKLFQEWVLKTKQDPGSRQQFCGKIPLSVSSLNPNVFFPDNILTVKKFTKETLHEHSIHVDNILNNEAENQRKLHESSRSNFFQPLNWPRLPFNRYTGDLWNFFFQYP